jgi:hypothetical protein
MVVFLASLGIAHWYWPDGYEDIGFALEELVTDELNPFVVGAVFVTTWLLFVCGALLGSACSCGKRKGTVAIGLSEDTRLLLAWPLLVRLKCNLQVFGNLLA